LSRITLPINGHLSELEIAINAAIKAGNEILKVYQTDFSTSTKSDNSPITEADVISNQIIKKSLADSGHEILSEEDKDDSCRLDLKKIWIIDPLDGTLDFVNKTGEFTVMIALIENNKPIIGVINWPVQNTLYIAQKGKGAYKKVNDQWSRIFVSKQNNISKCNTVGSRHHLSDVEKELMKKLDIANFKSVGSSLKVCLVSSGEADIYITTTNKMKEWDTAASHCIVSEAGGKMTTMKGEEILYNKKDVHHHDGVLVTNGLTHNTIINEYRNFLK
jgi:3'(2'), 5'-bisphosphate nucleotidase